MKASIVDILQATFCAVRDSGASRIGRPPSGKKSDRLVVIWLLILIDV